MGTILFTCPATGLKVQAWIADEPLPIEYFEAVECTACQRVHLVDPRTGRVAGDNDT